MKSSIYKYSGWVTKSLAATTAICAATSLYAAESVQQLGLDNGVVIDQQPVLETQQPPSAMPPKAIPPKAMPSSAIETSDNTRLQVPAQPPADQQPEIRCALGGSLGFASNKGPSGSDFDVTAAGELFVVLELHPNFSFEAGLYQTDTTESKATDNTGSYRLQITTRDFFVGARGRYEIDRQLGVYGRGGFLKYQADVKFEEAFFGLKDGGSLEKDEKGNGFYLGGGLDYRLAPQLLVSAELLYRVRQDHFSASPKAFDIKSVGSSLGLMYSF